MTINRAFIKAYRHDAAQPAPAPPLSNAMRSNAGWWGASVEYVGLPSAPQVAAGCSGASAEMAGTSQVDIATLSPAAAEQRTMAVRNVGTVSRPRPIGQASATKRPLSSFTDSRRASLAHTNRHERLSRVTDQTNDRPDANTYRPGTTIASFRWPPMCRTLAQQCSRPFDELAAELLTISKAGRTLIGFMNLFPGRGCTTLLLTTSMRLARTGNRIVIVDGNFCRPQLDSLLEIDPDPTWHDVLVAGVPVADAVVRALDDGIDLLPFAPTPHATPSAELARGLAATVTAGVLRHAYDLTLFDLGAFFDPVAQPITLELIHNMRLDAVVAVAGPEPADPRDLETLSQYLDERGCTLFGTIENRVASSS